MGYGTSFWSPMAARSASGASAGVAAAMLGSSWAARA